MGHNDLPHPALGYLHLHRGERAAQRRRGALLLSFPRNRSLDLPADLAGLHRDFDAASVVDEGACAGRSSELTLCSETGSSASKWLKRS